MKYFLIFPLVFSLSLISVHPVKANLLINELSSYSAEDWIEIYNDGSIPVTLSEFRIRDNSATNTLDLDGIISPYTVMAFGLKDYLNKPGDTVKIVAKSDENNIEDQITYGDGGTGVPGENQTLGRKANGSSEWVVFSTGSKGSSNEGVAIVEPTPTVTPTPTKVPTPTKIPTPTKVPTPTKIPTPTKSGSSPTSANAKSIGSTGPKSSSTKDGNVLGVSRAPQPTAVLSTNDVENEDTADQVIVEGAQGVNWQQRMLSVLPIAGGTLSLGACGILLFLHQRKKL